MVENVVVAVVVKVVVEVVVVVEVNTAVAMAMSSPRTGYEKLQILRRLLFQQGK